MPKTRVLNPRLGDVLPHPIFPTTTTTMPAKKHEPHPLLRAAAAAASDVALPTPPRTNSGKRKRSHSRATDSDDSGDELPEASHGSGVGALVLGHKKRKTLDELAAELSGAATAEDEFWLREGPSTLPAPDPARERSASPPPAVLAHKRRRMGLMSPPPSRRAPRLATPPPRMATPPPQPVTPSRARRRTRARVALPVRDSPNNPFLALPQADTADNNATSENASGSACPPAGPDKDVVRYVFRGKKVTYRLPRSPSPDPLLSPSHPDFAPSTDCAPRLLFPEARKHARDTKAASPQLPRTPRGGSEGWNALGEASGKGKAKERVSEWDTSDEESSAVVPVLAPVRAAVGRSHSVDAVVPTAGSVAAARDAQEDAVQATADNETIHAVPDAVKDVAQDPARDVTHDSAKVVATKVATKKPSSRAIANLPLRRSSRLAAQAAGKH